MTDFYLTTSDIGIRHDAVPVIGTPSTVGGLAIGLPNITPSPVDVSGAPVGASISMWVLGVDGTYRAQAFLDNTTVNAPSPPAGTLTFCRRLQYNDSGIVPQSLAQNAALGINHVAGNGGVQAASNKDERALAVEQANSGTAQAFNQLLGIYAELLLTGAPTLGGPAYAEVGSSAARATLSDARTDASGGGKIFAFSSSYIRGTDTVSYSSCSQGGCAGGNTSCVTNTGAGSIGGALLTSYFAKANNVNASATSGSYAGFASSIIQGFRFPTANYGFFASDYGANVSDWNFYSVSGAPDSGANFFGGPVVLGRAIRTARAGGSAPGNKDAAGKLTFAAVTTASYTYTETYSVAPIVIITPVNPGGITFTLTTSSTTGFTVTASSSFTGVVNYITIGQN